MEKKKNKNGSRSDRRRKSLFEISKSTTSWLGWFTKDIQIVSQEKSTADNIDEDALAMLEKYD